MKIERYKDEHYKYFYEECKDIAWYEDAEIPDELWTKYKAAEEALREAERELSKYF